MNRPTNRQISRDVRVVDLSSTDYASEISDHFMVRANTSGTASIRNTVTDTPVSVFLNEGQALEVLTDTVYKAGTDVGMELIAIY